VVLWLSGLFVGIKVDWDSTEEALELVRFSHVLEVKRINNASP
jgi:hypothetical protein